MMLYLLLLQLLLLDGAPCDCQAFETLPVLCFPPAAQQ
jgi:hypothetical protein